MSALQVYDEISFLSEMFESESSAASENISDPTSQLNYSNFEFQSKTSNAILHRKKGYE